MRQAARTDANQTEIVEGLRDAGYSVTVTSQLGKGFPDLAVGANGVTYLMELKCAGGKLTKDEIKWHAGWKGQKAVVESLEEALDVLEGG